MEFYTNPMPRMYYAEGEAECEPDFDNYEKCPLCGDTVGHVPKRPYTVVLKGRVRTRPMPDCLHIWTWFFNAFSKKVVDAIEKYGIAGIEYYEKADRYIYKKETLDFDYYIPKVKRIDLPTDYEKSCISWLQNTTPREICPLCTPQPRVSFQYMSLLFQTDKYDGTDIFKTYEHGEMIFFSQKFVDMVKAEGFTNFNFLSTRLLGAELLTSFCHSYGDHGEKDEAYRKWLHLSPEEYYGYIDSVKNGGTEK